MPEVSEKQVFLAKSGFWARFWYGLWLKNNFLTYVLNSETNVFGDEKMHKANPGSGLRKCEILSKGCIHNSGIVLKWQRNHNGEEDP